MTTRRLLTVGIFFAVLSLVLTACSHEGDIQDAQAAAATAKRNADLAHAAVLMRVSDYNSEIGYAAGLLSPGPEKKAMQEIVGLEGDLVGNGKLTEVQRENFVTSLIRDDLKAHRDLYQAGQDDIALKDKVVKSDQKAAVAETKANNLALQAGVAWDSFDRLKDYFIWAVVALLAIYVLHVLYTWGVFGATVAAKVP